MLIVCHCEASTAGDLSALTNLHLSQSTLPSEGHIMNTHEPLCLLREAIYFLWLLDKEEALELWLLRWKVVVMPNDF